MIELKVWGDFACFTRPENKVERVSYEVMTPSAARGVLEGVFWKPEMRYCIREIWVLNPIKHLSLVRNEVKSIASGRAAKKWSEQGGGYLADEDRTQRHALILRDVAYIIRAEIQLTKRADAAIDKYHAMASERIKKGQAYRMPYLGNREFSAHFSAPDGSEVAIDESHDLGRMLFDIEFMAQNKGPVQFKQHQASISRVVDGLATPRFFAARLEQGILRVPAALYQGNDQGNDQGDS
jgi:CRISPR-associated protein Cas5d